MPAYTYTATASAAIHTGAKVIFIDSRKDSTEIHNLWCGDILYAYKTIAVYSKKPVVSAVCLGYAEESPPARPRKSIEEKCIFI